MTMYEELLEALKKYYVIPENETQKILDLIQDNVEFTWYERVDFNTLTKIKEIKYFDELEALKHEKVYLFWDIEEHILVTNIESILNSWDDVEALGTRTWIVSIKFDFVIEFAHDKMILGFRNE